MSCIALVAGGLTAVTPAAAQDEGTASADEGADRETRALLDRGLDHRERQEDREALALFRQAYEQGGSREARAQMALAEQALGDWLAAEADLAAALDGPDAWIDPRRDVLEAELETIRARLGRLEVVGGVEGATVHLDGRLLTTLPQNGPSFALPGRARLEVRLEGYRSIDRTVEVQPGQLTRETIQMHPEPDASVPDASLPDEPEPTPVEVAPEAPAPRLPAPRPEEPGGEGPWTGLAVASFVVAGLAFGGGVGALAWREERAGEWNSDTCLGNDPARSRMDNCGPVLDEIRLGEGLAAAGLVLGGVLTGVGIAFLVVGDDDGAAALSCVPGVGGVACGGMF